MESAMLERLFSWMCPLAKDSCAFHKLLALAMDKVGLKWKPVAQLMHKSGLSQDVGASMMELLQVK